MIMFVAKYLEVPSGLFAAKDNCRRGVKGSAVDW